MKKTQESTSSTTMSLRQGAKYLGIGINAMYGHVNAGRIKVVSYPGRAYRLVTIAALDAFRDAHTHRLSENNGQVEQPEASPARTLKHREAELDAVFARKPRAVNVQ